MVWCVLMLLFVTGHLVFLLFLTIHEHHTTLLIAQDETPKFQICPVVSNFSTLKTDTSFFSLFFSFFGVCWVFGVFCCCFSVSVIQNLICTTRSLTSVYDLSACVCGGGGGFKSIVSSEEQSARLMKAMIKNNYAAHLFYLQLQMSTTIIVRYIYSQLQMSTAIIVRYIYSQLQMSTAIIVRYIYSQPQMSTAIIVRYIYSQLQMSTAIIVRYIYSQLQMSTAIIVRYIYSQLQMSTAIIVRYIYSQLQMSTAIIVRYIYSQLQMSTAIIVRYIYSQLQMSTAITAAHLVTAANVQHSQSPNNSVLINNLKTLQKSVHLNITSSCPAEMQFANKIQIQKSTACKKRTVHCYVNSTDRFITIPNSSGENRKTTPKHCKMGHFAN